MDMAKTQVIQIAKVRHGSKCINASLPSLAEKKVRHAQSTSGDRSRL